MKQIIRKKRLLIDSWHPPIFSYILQIKKELKGYQSILDVGCGMRSPVSYVDCAYTVGIDLNPNTIQKAKEFATHHEYVYGDVNKLSNFFKPHSFDAVVCFDVIEHITKSEGIKLMKQMELIARKKIIICTPNGFMHQKEEDNPLQNHQSGWSTQDFTSRGYDVHGILGPRFLRKEQHEYTVHRLAGFLLSELLQITYTHSRPEKAAALMAIKKVQNDSSKK